MKTFDLDAFLADLPPYISLDIETLGLDRADEVVSLAIAWAWEDEKVQDTHCFHLDRYVPGTEADIAACGKLLKATLFNPDYQGTIVVHNGLGFDIPRLIPRFYQ